jgi:hypothetical protein
VLACLLNIYPILDGRTVLLYLFIGRVIDLAVVNNMQYHLSTLYKIVCNTFSILIMCVHKITGNCLWSFKYNRSTTDLVFLHLSGTGRVPAVQRDSTSSVYRLVDL